VQEALISSGGGKKYKEGEIGCHTNTGSNKNPFKKPPLNINKGTTPKE